MPGGTSKGGGGSEFVVVHGDQQVPGAKVTLAIAQRALADLKAKKRARGAVDSSGTLDPKATRPLSK